MTCCAATRCNDRVPLPDGGWACRTALRRGWLSGPVAQPTALDPRRPGWSRGAVLPCPACGCRAHMAGPAFPQRRCHGCGQVFDPEAADPSITEPAANPSRPAGPTNPDPSRQRALLMNTDPED